MMYTISVRASQETHYVSATKPNRLMLFRERVGVYCENHVDTQMHSVGRMQSFSVLRQVTFVYTACI
jgi:hypothetical protein